MNIQISVDELKKHKIFIGTPMYGGNCSGSYTKSCTDLAMMCAANGITIKFYYLFNESLIQRARNYVADEFMRSDCTHLVFIDSDIAFNPKDVLGLLAVQLKDPDLYNIVCGPYPKKTIAWEKVKAAVDKGKADESPFELDQYTADYVFNPVNKLGSFNLGEPLEIGEGGTGFMCIPRATFERYKEAYPEYSYKPDHARTENFDGTNEIMAYFDCIIDPVSKRYLSEDYFFCHKAREAGMKVWMAPWMQINHIGTYIFKGNMAAIGSLGVSATADKSSSSRNYKKKKKR
jgi:hypothetical protein|tara:strand:+ start:939 stop:1805 length:867 start_codon:yes stop_codon:yes gene_type:complete